MPRTAWTAAACAFLLTLTRLVSAEPDEERAQALFSEAKKLLDESQIEAACEKFRESYEIVRGIGVQYNLAGCYARLGRTASAYRHYLEVADVAARTGQSQRAEVARKQASDLEPRLIRLRFVLEEELEGLVLSIDGAPLAASELDATRPVDPGRHTVTAVAPEREGFSTMVDAAGEGQTIEIRIPALTVVERTLPAPAPSSPDEGLGALGYTGIGLGVLGLAVLAAAGVTAGLAKSRDGEADEHCDATGCSEEGVALGDEAVLLGNAATGLTVTGGVVAAAGVILFVVDVTSAPELASWWRVVPLVDRGLAGAMFTAAF